MTTDERQGTLARQAELYGVPFAGSVSRVVASLDLSQAAVARVLGISPPMLSQLVTGQRIKLGNPHALHRLQELLALVDEIEHGLPHEQVAPRLQKIAVSSSTTLTATHPQRTSTDPDLPALVSRLLRAVASGRELAAAAEALRAEHPDLAELLRVYGTGSPEEARRHFAGVADLLQGQ